MSADPRDAAERPTSRIGVGQVFLGTGSEPLEGVTSEDLANVYRLNDPVFAELPLEQLMDEQLASVKEILSVDTVAILLINDMGDRLVARAAKGLEEEVERGVQIPVGRGFAGRIASERLPIFIADVNHADVLNPILREKGIRSLLGVPLIVEGDLLGVLHVGALSPRTFTNKDASVLQLVAARVAPAIERARLLDALDREHRGAVALQRSLLPEQLPELVGASVSAHYLPAKDEVGGDWYDVIELGAGRVGLAIGDVAGHGVRAATLMGSSALRFESTPSTVTHREKSWDASIVFCSPSTDVAWRQPPMRLSTSTAADSPFRLPAIHPPLSVAPIVLRSCSRYSRARRLARSRSPTSTRRR